MEKIKSIITREQLAIMIEKLVINSELDKFTAISFDGLNLSIEYFINGKGITGSEFKFENSFDNKENIVVYINDYYDEEGQIIDDMLFEIEEDGLIDDIFLKIEEKFKLLDSISCKVILDNYNLFYDYLEFDELKTKEATLNYNWDCFQFYEDDNVFEYNISDILKIDFECNFNTDII